MEDTLKDPDTKPLDVVVIGAGPVGLLAAIEAYRSGSSVHVVERLLTPGGARGTGRDEWLDILGAPWFPSNLDHLTGPGLGSLHTLRAMRSGPSHATLPKADLAAFLRKVLAAFGVPLHAGKEFLATCPPPPAGPDPGAKASVLYRNVVFPFSEGELGALHRMDREELCDAGRLAAAFNLTVSFHRVAADGSIGQAAFGFLAADVVVGADGGQSAVRADMGASFSPVPSVLFGRRDEPVRNPGLAQVSVVAEFARQAGGACPELLPGPQATDPTYWGFIVPGVISVTRRFYDGAACTLEIYVTESLAQRATPASVVARVARAALVDGPLAEANLAQHLDSVDAVLEWERSEPRLSSDLIALVPGSRGRRGHVSVLVGSSGLQARTRLALDASTSLVEVSDLGIFLKYANHLGERCLGSGEEDKELAKRLADVVAQKAARERTRGEAYAQLAASTVLYESRCGLVVGFDAHMHNVLKAPVLYARVQGDYEDVDYATLDPRGTCGLQG